MPKRNCVISFNLLRYAKGKSYHIAVFTGMKGMGIRQETETRGTIQTRVGMSTARLKDPCLFRVRTAKFLKRSLRSVQHVWERGKAGAVCSVTPHSAMSAYLHEFAEEIWRKGDHLQR